jgi:D-alanyl-D-alanine endopeptidase (penicillin-binding protein 7)
MVIFLLLILLTLPAHATDITAHSWVVADSQGNIIKEWNADQVRSIASITKLMTAMVVLDAKQDLTERIHYGMTRQQTIELALVRSDNKSATALCQKYPNGYRTCLAKMNEKARELGLENTHFLDSTGLSVMNISTARELIKIVLAAQHYPEIRSAANTSYMLALNKRHKSRLVYNTNRDIGTFYKFIVSKTGHINASGWNFATLVDTGIDRRVVVVLGCESKESRIPEAEVLANIPRNNF